MLSVGNALNRINSNTGVAEFDFSLLDRLKNWGSGLFGGQVASLLSVTQAASGYNFGLPGTDANGMTPQMRSATANALQPVRIDRTMDNLPSVRNAIAQTRGMDRLPGNPWGSLYNDATTQMNNAMPSIHRNFYAADLQNPNALAGLDLLRKGEGGRAGL